MYAHVRLLNGFAKPLVYKIPQSWEHKDIEGCLITVPLRNQQIPALVIRVAPNAPKTAGFAIREAIALEAFPKDAHYTSFITKVAHDYCIEPLSFYQRIKSFITSQQEETIDAADKKNNESSSSVRLTCDQQKIVDFITPYIAQGAFLPSLLHGVTGSGKTEVYKELMLKALKGNKSVLFLLPEVSLCMQFEHRLKASMPPQTPLFGFHSATKPQDKKELWARLIKGAPTIILGVHLPVLLPVQDLGLIIVDEEHDTNYLEKRAPHFHSREIALERAKISRIPILLGSATPSISSLYKVKHEGGWKFFQLKERFGGSFPTIELAHLSKLRKGPQNFWITPQLKKAIETALSKKEQVLIYINRRGYSFFIKCSACGFIAECPHCSVSLTLHQEDHLVLRCHYCPYEQEAPQYCPECKAGEKDLIKKGIGTQQATAILESLFPHARIYRADLDTTKKKRAWQQTILKFEQGEGDILVGTQTITKGYHFPNVTLVGVLWADLGLNFPSFSASEVTLQKLIQVAGRAGRAKKESRVIVQTLGPHPIFDYLNETDYLSFYRSEIEHRLVTHYPPAAHLVCIELRNTNPTLLDLESEGYMATLDGLSNESVRVLGPVKPPVYKIQKIHIRHIFLKSPSEEALYALLDATEPNRKKYKSSMCVTPVF